jgi:hypothetical protein
MLNLKALDRAFDTERYVLSVQPNATRSGGNLIATCPRCEKDKLWVLVVDRDDIRAPAWQCFSLDCSDSGRTALSLVRRLEDCDTFRAFELIQKFQKGNEPIIDLRRLVEDRLVGSVELWTAEGERIPLPDEFIRVEHGAKRGELPPYFAARGIGPKKAHRYGLGWCTDGYFKNRLVVPVVSGGEVAFFVARYMKAKLPDGVKKTLYPKGAKPGRYLYNYDRAKTCERIRIVEGVLDAIHIGRSAVATFGTSLSQYQLELLMRTAAKEITIMWDRDAIDKARELADRLSDLWTVRVVELPDARDPDEHTLDDLLAMEKTAPALDTAGARRAYVIGRLERAS